MIIDREYYTNHINDIDQVVNMRRVLDKIEIVLRRHDNEHTDFLDPYERRLARSILNRFADISYKELGGFAEAERKVISIYPDYCNYEEFEIPIKGLEIGGPISRLSHRDFLGSMLGLGISRDKIGDILIHKDYVQIAVKNEAANFILFNLEKVGNINVNIKKISLKEFKLGKIEHKEISAVVPSLRLDNLMTCAWKLNRSNSKKLIESGNVKINWEPVEKTFVKIKEDDLISAKGYGRFILDSIDGVTRKGNIHVKMKLLK